jgi:Ni,Fe-hydrogenase I large subunit
MAVLVKRNGLLGHAYMAAILPFRHFIVYPRMLDEIGRRWRARAPAEQWVGQRPLQISLNEGVTVVGDASDCRGCTPIWSWPSS